MTRAGKANGPLRLEWVQTADALIGLTSAWNALLDRDREASIFLTPEWVSTWWREIGKGELCALAVFRSEQLVALAPLVETREVRAAMPLRVLSFIGERPRGVAPGVAQADQLGFIADEADPEALEVLTREVVGATGRLDWFRLHEVREGTRSDAALRAVLASQPTRALVKICSRTPLLSLHGEWQKIEAGFSASLRKRIRRANKKREGIEGVVLRRWLPEPRELDALLRRFAEIEGQSWKGQCGVGIFSDGSSRRFLSAIACEFSERGWLDVSTFEVEGELAAYRLGFRFRGIYLDYNFAHHPRYAELSPGRILLHEIVKDSHRIGLVGIDASGGSPTEPPLLADWTDETRAHNTWMFFGSSLRGRALFLAAARVQPALARLRKRNGAGETASAVRTPA